MEVASYLHDKAKSVTLISRASVPLRNVVGKTVGDALKRVSYKKFTQSRIVVNMMYDMWNIPHHAQTEPNGRGPCQTSLTG